ncbi:hypothetical protein L917_08498 [Phytophthora nicotianae]|uniref:DDE Tnp4 domain-containing protein n=1 Tax=Phytophthora nicotianae TaxID=4792 RepID=W2L7B4_PHYNI|nr:hypothetical protein L917_08498 [Phytophthora nicotianae]
MVYLASGGSMDNAATVLGMSKSSAVVYINQVLSVLSKMAKQKITLPSTSAEIKRVSLGFEKIAGFPDVIGAIDGSLIRISRPAEHEGWYCRKNFPAVNMQAVVDHQTAFRSFSIRAGSMNDQSLWNLSGLRNKSTIPAGMHFVGDAGYKIFRHLLTPFDEAAAAHCPKKKRYNYKLSQTRITVERAFGILKNRFRVLLMKVQMKSPQKVTQLIVSCMVLHNLMIELKDTYIVVGDDPDPARPRQLSTLADEDDLSHEQGVAKQSDIMDYLFRL